MGRMGLVGRPGCSDEVRIRRPRPPAPDDRTRSGTAPPPRAWRVAVPRTAGGRRSGWRRPAAGGSPHRGTRPGMTGVAPAGRRGPGQEVRGRLRNGVGRRETDRRAPGPACAMRAQRDAVHPASRRASPARRNPPALDSCEPASHNATPDDITNSTPSGLAPGSSRAGTRRVPGRVPDPPGAETRTSSSRPLMRADAIPPVGGDSQRVGLGRRRSTSHQESRLESP